MDAGRYIEDPHFHQGYIEPRKRKLNWPLIIGVVVIVLALILVLLRLLVFDFYRVPGNSMAPQLSKGDVYLVNRPAARAELPRGAIAVFRTPQSRGVVAMQRVAALPGERFEIKNGFVYINYIEHKLQFLNGTPSEPFGPITVPPGHYLMLADNINAAIDSREFGCVPRGNLVGRLVMKLSEGPEEFEMPVSEQRRGFQ